jgi:nucleoside-diphosphate-sugar epimerase
MSGTLVTGATGFIGQHLVHELTSRGENVTVLHRQQSAPSPALAEFSERGANVKLYANYDELMELVATSAPERVFHLATHYVREHTPSDISDLIDANVTMGTYLLEALTGCPCVVVSTMSFFQFTGGIASPYSLYSASKQAFMEVAAYYREREHLDVRSVVLYDTYGPRDTREKIIPRMMGAVARGDALAMGPSAQPLDLLYISDVVSGLLQAAEPMQPSVMGLRAAAETTVGELVAVVEQISGRDLIKTFNENQPVNLLVRESGEWVVPMGWKPRVALEEGIRYVWSDARLPGLDSS